MRTTVILRAHPTKDFEKIIVPIPMPVVTDIV